MAATSYYYRVVIILNLGLQFYVDTFRQIKQEFPAIKLHALGPPK